MCAPALGVKAIGIIAYSNSMLAHPARLCMSDSTRLDMQMIRARHLALRVLTMMAMLPTRRTGAGHRWARTHRAA